jgi:IS1 family transposase
VRGKRELKTARKSREGLKRLNITYDTTASDDGDSFVMAFGEDKQLMSKEYRVGIEGNKNRLGDRIRMRLNGRAVSQKAFLSS